MPIKVLPLELQDANDAVLHPLTPQDPHPEQMRVGQKNLLQGDVLAWTRKKTMLDIDTVADTISLLSHHPDRLCKLFQTVRPRKHLPTGQWHQILGELRMIVIALPSYAHG
ncbi:hypothetical protein MHU86_3528 [Fragilaria crotonensis]|nr:hypothetical protein MHU86_9270 [Fragilaria crotonensis]KAI2510907.1 hypothetical protein MHU86_3528 [Fragilaria crotonensis]